MSEKIKSILKVIIYAATIISVGAVLVMAFNRKNYLESHDETFESQYEASYELLNMMLENDESYYDDEQIDTYVSDPETLEKLQKDYQGYADFINGMIAVHENKDSCTEYLNAALKDLELPYYQTYYDEDTIQNDLAEKRISTLSELTQNVGARCYYELARRCIDTKHYDIIDGYYNLMNSTLDVETSLNVYVFLNTWASYDVEEIPNGAEKAVEILEDLYDVAVANNYAEPEAILMSLADAYGNVGNSVKFVNTELEALEMVQENGDIYNQVLINSSIGLEYLDEYNIEKATSYMEDAYNLVYKDDPQTEYYLKTYICSNLALIKIREGSYDEALGYIDEAESYREKQTDEASARDDKANILTLQAEYEIAEGDADKAIEYLDEAYEIFNSSTSFSYSNFELEVDVLYGKAYLELGNGEKALEYYKLGEAECIETGIDTDSRCYQGLYYSYKMLGNDKEAFNYAEKYADALSEKIYDSQENQAAYLLEEFQSNEKDTQISELSTKSRMYSLVIILSVVVVAFIIFGFYGNVKNSRRIKKFNAELKELSERDGLTGLYNRRKLDDYLSANWDNILGQCNTVAVAMVDVDFFKLYNDFYGHQMGDGALVSVSNVLKSVTSRSLETINDSFAARYGGEEFLLIMPGQSKTTMEMIIQNIRIQMSNLNISHAKSTVAERITLSIGCAIVEKSEDSSNINYEAAISLADKALYEAKQDRNTYVMK